MPPQTITALRARWVFPISSPPLRDGIVTIRGQQILAVGPKADVRSIIDLGNVAIVPGLVNAHTHLEFSLLERPLGEPGTSLPNWIRQVIAYRQSAAENKAAAVAAGLEECARQGTTTVGEISTAPWMPRPSGPDVDGPAAIVFRETIGRTNEQRAACLAASRDHLQRDWTVGSDRPGLSPHAPYSVHSALLADLVGLASTHGVPLAMHVAESREEIELLHGGCGPFYDLLVEVGAWRPDALSAGGRPLDYLRILAAAPRTLVIHGNYLDAEEIAYLAERRERMSVVYCPRTHNYFRHEAYPLAALLAAGANVALGTDSRASTPDLSLLAEMQFLAAHDPQIAPTTVLELGTAAGARALGIDRHVGTLEPGKLADLAIIALPHQRAGDPHALLFDRTSRVVETWRHGRRVHSMGSEA